MPNYYNTSSTSEKITTHMNILLLGIGNILLKDEGIGVHVVQKIINENIIFPKPLEVIDGATAGYDLLPILQQRDFIIIIDSLKIEDTPGSIYHYPLSELKLQTKDSSSHDLNISHLFELLKLLDNDPVVECIGIVPEDYSTYDMTLTETLTAIVPKVINKIEEIVHNLN